MNQLADPHKQVTMDYATGRHYGKTEDDRTVVAWFYVEDHEGDETQLFYFPTARFEIHILEVQVWDDDHGWLDINEVDEQEIANYLVNCAGISSQESEVYYA